MEKKETDAKKYVASFFIGAAIAVLIEELSNKFSKPQNILPACLVGGGLGLMSYGIYDACKKDDDDATDSSGEAPILIAYNGKEHFLKFSKEQIRKERERAALEEFNFYIPELLFLYLTQTQVTALAAEFVKYKMQSEIKGFGNFLLEDNKNMMFDVGFAIFIGLCFMRGVFDKKTTDGLVKVYRKHEKEIKDTLDIEKLTEFFNVLFKEGFKKALDILKEAFADKKLFSKEVISEMAECLKSYAKSLFPKVGTLYEEQKNAIFNEQDWNQSKESVLESAKKTVAILLWEFATGSGETERGFCKGNFLTAFLNAGCKYGAVDKVKIIKDKIREQRCTLEQFKIDGVKIKKIAFSPDDKDLTLKESYDNHFNSNIAQFFVGGVGAVSVSYEGLANGRIKMHVQFSNETSMSSLFLHLSEDVHRIDTDKNYDGTYPALSTITQVFDFYIYADATERLFL